MHQLLAVCVSVTWQQQMACFVLSRVCCCRVVRAARIKSGPRGPVSVLAFIYSALVIFPSLRATAW